MRRSTTLAVLAPVVYAQLDPSCCPCAASSTLTQAITTITVTSTVSESPTILRVSDGEVLSPLPAVTVTIERTVIQQPATVYITQAFSTEAAALAGAQTAIAPAEASSADLQILSADEDNEVATVRIDDQDIQADSNRMRIDVEVASSTDQTSLEPAPTNSDQGDRDPEAHSSERVREVTRTITQDNMRTVTATVEAARLAVTAGPESSPSERRITTTRTKTIDAGRVEVEVNVDVEVSKEFRISRTAAQERQTRTCTAFQASTSLVTEYNTVYVAVEPSVSWSNTTSLEGNRTVQIVGNVTINGTVEEVRPSGNGTRGLRVRGPVGPVRLR